jgi:hypothetical protein
VWGAEGRHRADGSVDVPAHGARTITVLRKSVVTVVLAGTDRAVGVRRHLKAPRDGTALPPGVEPGHGPFQAILTRWVQRTIGA